MSRKTAVLCHVSGMSFVAHADSNHFVPIDSSADGGPTLASSPMELLLISLGGCTGSDVVSILQKKRTEVQAFELHVTGERRDEHPKVYTRISVEFVVRGRGIKSEDVERAIELSSTQYCSVSAMLRNGGVELEYSYKILEE
ncbi:MAG: OsmC family protein [Bacteroidota bacterium]